MIVNVKIKTSREQANSAPMLRLINVLSEL